MKKDLLTLLCMTLVCASVMLGIMSVYKMVGAQSRKGLDSDTKIESAAFRAKGLKQLF